MAQQQQNQKSSFADQYRIAQALLELPSLTILPFVHKKLGFRLMAPGRQLAITMFLVVVSVLAFPGSDGNNPMFLLYFALGSFILAITARIKAWWGLYRGVQQHSYNFGDSRFRQLPWLPDFFRRGTRRVERFLDPAICLLAALAFHPFSHALSGWLAVSGVSLRYTEYAIYSKYLNMDLDLRDDVLQAERQTGVIEQFENAKGTGQKQPSAGVNTGIGPDIKENVKNKEKHNPQLN